MEDIVCHRVCSWGCLLAGLAVVGAETRAESIAASFGLSGAGQTVVVIDSGIAYDHMAFAGRYVGGWDFAENDADPYDDASIKSSHGTHIAGVVASGDPNHLGVAHGADVVSLRVFDDRGAVYFSWVEQALRWVKDNLHSYRNPITTVTLSIGTTWNAETPPPGSVLEDELADLRAAGVFVSASAGNDFAAFGVPGLNYPSSSPSVTAAMAWQANGLAAYSQRSESAVAAPGANIMGPVPDYVGNQNGIDDDWARKSGTSIASPYVAGASMLVREALGRSDPLSISPDQIYETLRSTADSFFDPITERTYRRINLQAALQSVVSPIDGDLNHDGFVDAADYSAWRDGLGTLYTQADYDTWRIAYSALTPQTSPGDFNNDGTVDGADYTAWRDGLGTKYTQQDYSVWRGAFSGAAALSGLGDLKSAARFELATVPEPSAFCMAWLLAVAASLSCRSRRRSHPNDSIVALDD